MLTKEKLLKKMRDRALSKEFIDELNTTLEIIREQEEQHRIEQQQWWDKHKHDTYNI